MVINRKSFLLLWVYSCGLYFTQILSVSPIYPIFIIVLVFSLLYIIKNYPRSTVTRLSLFATFFSLLFIYQTVIAGPSFYMNLLMTCLSPVLIFTLGKNQSFSSKHCHNLMLIYAVIFIFDFIWRFFNPATDMNIEKLDAIGYGFQIYKMNSIMYGDSNFVGVQGIVFLSFYLWLWFEKVVIPKWPILIILVISILLSLSRAAAIALVLSFILLIALRNLKIMIYLFPVVFIAVVYAVIQLFEFSYSDPSFHHRFEIFGLLTNFLEEADLISVIFGVGIGNAKEFIGIGAHSLIPMLMIELGVLGTITFFVFLFWCFTKKVSTILMIIPFLTCSLATASTAVPFFTTLMSLTYLISKNKLTISD